MTKTVFDDPEFLDHVVGLLTQDAQALHTLSPLLEVDDFKPLRGVEWSQERWVVADRALQYYQRFHQPLGKLLRADILEYAHGLQLTERQVDQLDGYLAVLQKVKLNGAAAIIEKVSTFKLQRIKAATIQEMIDLQAAGELTNERWLELCQKAVSTKNGRAPVTSYFDTFDTRQQRRNLRSLHDTNPVYLIEPLDNICAPWLGPKQLGLIIGPTTRGKSLMLIWLAISYTLQNFNVLYITLEDSKEDTENRMDSMVTGVPFYQLHTSFDTTARFASYQRLIDSKLHVIDGTEEKYTIATVEQRVQEQIEEGFRPQVIVVDYDKFLRADIRSTNQTEIMDSVYQDFRRMISKHNLIGWTAAQTQRKTSDFKVLSGDRVADAFEKIRQSVVVISLGQGELTPDSLYFWVVKNKFGKKHQGCHIIPNLEKSLIYDHEATRKTLNVVKAEQQEESEEFPAE